MHQVWDLGYIYIYIYIHIYISLSLSLSASLSIDLSFYLSKLKETDPRGPAESVSEAPLYLTFRGLVVSLRNPAYGMHLAQEKEQGLK